MTSAAAAVPAAGAAGVDDVPYEDLTITTAGATGPGGGSAGGSAA